MTIVLLLFIATLFLANSLAMADGPSGGGRALDEQPDDDIVADVMAEIEGAEPDGEDAAEAAVGASAPEPARSASSGRSAVPRSPGAAGAAAGNAPNATPTTPDPADLVGQIARAYKLGDAETQALASLPPEQQTAVAHILDGCWQRYHEAATTMVTEYRAALQAQDAANEYFAQVDAWCQDPQALAQYLQSKPELLTAVGQYLNFGAPATSGGAGSVNVENLDPEMRTVYETMQRNVTALGQRLDEARRQLGEVSQRDRQRSASEQEQLHDRATGDITRLAKDLDQRIGAELGLTLRDHPDAYNKAWGEVYIAAKSGAFSGLKADQLLEAIEQRLRIGCRVAGFHDIRAARQREARTTARPPGRRSAGSATALNLDELVDSALGVEGL